MGALCYSLDYTGPVKRVITDHDKIKLLVKRNLTKGRSHKKFIRAIGYERSIQYLLNDIRLDVVYDFLCGKNINETKYGRKEYIKMFGSEFNVLQKNELTEMGVSRVDSEVPILDRRADIVAYFNGLEAPMIREYQDGRMVEQQFSAGIWGIENKTNISTMNELRKLIKQIMYMKMLTNKVCLTVPKDRTLFQELRTTICNTGAIIRKSRITTQDIRDSLNMLRIAF